MRKARYCFFGAVVAVTVCLGYLSAGPVPSYSAPTVVIPLYGVGMAQTQEPPKDAVLDALAKLSERLAAVEAKLDALLKLVDEPAQDQKSAAQPTEVLVSGATKCASCHLPNIAESKGGGFRLFTPAGTFATLTPRQLAQVRKRLATTDPSFQMPPPKSGPTLTDPERAALVAAFQEVPKEKVP